MNKFVVAARDITTWPTIARALFACLLALTAPSNALCQPPPQASPADFGLLLPTEGLVRQGEGRRVLFALEGKQTVALLHLEIGDRRVLILPDGRLSTIPAAESKPTDQPFKAISKEDLAKQFTSGKFAAFKTRTTNRYLYVYNTSEGFYKATSRILETMFPAIQANFKRLKFSVQDPPTPLIIIMFKTEQEFQQYHRMPPGVVAYYSAVSNHIVMYEQSKLVEAAPELAIRQSLSTIAHEGVHQILHNIGVQHRLARWPMWISEGLPEYFAPTTTDKRLRWKGVGEVNDMRMYELEKLLASREQSNGKIIEEVLTAPELTSVGYAASWALVHYLAKTKKEKFEAYLRDVADAKPMTERGQTIGGLVTTDRALFVEHFGEDFAKLEAGMIKHLQKLPYTNPFENQTHYVAMLDIARGAGVVRVMCISPSPSRIETWRNQALQQYGVQAQNATFQVQSFPTRAAAEQYANSN